MRSPCFALIWSQWRSTRWPLLAQLVLLAHVSAWVAFALDGWRWDPHDVATTFALLSVFLLVFPCVTLLFSDCGASNLRPNIAQRAYALPVRTRTLALAYLGYRITALAFIALLVGVAFVTTCGYDFASWDTAVTMTLWPVGAVAAFMCFQAVLWTAGPVHWAAVPLGLGLIWLALRAGASLLWAAGLGRSFAESFGTADWMLFLVLIPFIAAMTLVAWAGLALDRRGTLATLRGRLGALRFHTGPRRMRAFRSPAEAQRWFEWRTKGHVLPVLVLLLFLAAWMANMITSRHWVDSNPSMYLATAFLVLFVSTVIGGVLLGRMNSDADAVLVRRMRRLNISSAYAMVRPMSTVAIAMARLRAMARSVAYTYLLLLAGFVIWCVATGSTARMASIATDIATELFTTLTLRDQTVVLGVVLLGLAAIAGHAILVWSLLVLFGPLFGAFVLAWLAMIAAMLIAGVAHLLGIPLSNGADTVFGYTFCIVFAWGVALLWAWALGVVRRRRLFGAKARRRTLVTALGLCVCTGCLVTVLFLSDWNPDVFFEWPQVIRWIGLWAIAALTVCAPLVVTPAMVDRLRHR